MFIFGSSSVAVDGFVIQSMAPNVHRLDGGICVFGDLRGV
jgi:hypothetical protein